VKAVSVPVLAHRMVLRPDAGARGLTAEIVIQDLFNAVAVPAGR
jgi:MoxR-like ATPase